MIRILLRRSWLFRAPLWLAAAGLLLWAALHWDWWGWARGLVIVFVAVVGLVAVSTFAGGLAVLTRAGFWLPGPGGGRWSDVIARDGYELTMRVSDSMGFLRVVSFERVREWPATLRWLDRFVPRDLPTPERAEPDCSFVSRVDAWAGRLLDRLEDRCEPPEHVRRWVLPSDESPRHGLVISFAPTAAGSLVELSITESRSCPRSQWTGASRCMRSVNARQTSTRRPVRSPVLPSRGRSPFWRPCSGTRRVRPSRPGRSWTPTAKPSSSIATG